MTKTTLHDLVATIASAVGTAQDLVERNYLSVVRRYFDDEGHPLTMTIKLPTMSAGVDVAERRIAVPVLSLVDSRALGIKSVDISLDVALDDFEAQDDPVTTATALEGAPLDYMDVGRRAADAPLAVLRPAAAPPPHRPAMGVRLPEAGPVGPTARITLRVEEKTTSEALARLVAKLDTLI